jgi:hypothetical protein
VRCLTGQGHERPIEAPSWQVREGSADADAVPWLSAVTVERGLRAALLIGGAYLDTSKNLGESDVN